MRTLHALAVLAAVLLAAPIASNTNASPSPSAPVPTGGVRFVATPFKGTAMVNVEGHLAANLVNTDAVLVSNGVDGVLTMSESRRRP